MKSDFRFSDQPGRIVVPNEEHARFTNLGRLFRCTAVLGLLFWAVVVWLVVRR